MASLYNGKFLLSKKKYSTSFLSVPCLPSVSHMYIIKCHHRNEANDQNNTFCTTQGPTRNFSNHKDQNENTSKILGPKCVFFLVQKKKTKIITQVYDIQALSRLN